MKEGAIYQANYDGGINFIQFVGEYERNTKGGSTRIGKFLPVEITTLGVSTDGYVRVLLTPHRYGVPLFEVQDVIKR